MLATIRAAEPRSRPAPPAPAAPYSLAEVLDRILNRGVALEGNLTISVADVDLLFLDLRVLLAAVDTIWPDGRPQFRTAPAPDGKPPETPPRSSPQSSPPPAPTGLIPPPASHGAGESGQAGHTREQPAAPPASGLVRLVLTLVNLLHDVLEKQAVRRMAAGHLTATQIEDIGLALFAQTQEIERLRRHFGFADRDLELRLDLADRFS